MRALAPLNNSVVFKKLFRDPEILREFIKDLVGVELNITAENIEMEKRFNPAIGAIDIALDIFVEVPTQRMIVEIQRVHYDYHFDRFMHYHMAAIVELAKSHKHYKLNREVHTIVWLTGTIPEQEYQKALLITPLHTYDESDKLVRIFPHKLYFLNPYYLNEKVPPRIADWFKLVNESIRHPKKPDLNFSRAIFSKATQLIADDDLTPRERAILLEEVGYEDNLRLHEEQGRREGLQEGHQKGLQEGHQKGLQEGVQFGEQSKAMEIARTMLANGFEASQIAQITGLTLEQVLAARG